MTESRLEAVKLYYAYTSPYAYLAMGPAYALEQSHRIRLRFIPFGVNIGQVYGEARGRPARLQDKVRYLYLDARRFAHERGLVIRAPRRIYSARLAMIGGLFADRHGSLRSYSDRIFERFFKRELEVEDQVALEAVMAEVGLPVEEFRRWAPAEGRAELARAFAEANQDQVFGVPTFVVQGELFWGHDRIEWVVRKLDALGLRRPG